jgi:hypothetical protein
MKLSFRFLLQRIDWLLNQRITNFISTFFLAAFAFWDIFDQMLLGGGSAFGAEHGVAIHGTFMLMKSGADFLVNSREATKHFHAIKGELRDDDE